MDEKSRDKAISALSDICGTSEEQVKEFFDNKKKVSELHTLVKSGGSDDDVRAFCEKNGIEVEPALIFAHRLRPYYTPNISPEEKTRIFQQSLKAQKEKQERETVKASDLLKVRMLPVNPDVRGYTNLFECSKCHGVAHLGEYTKEYEYDYCPNCGKEVIE